MKNDVIKTVRVAALFEIWVGERLPFAKMKVKVLEEEAGLFLAVPNVAIRSASSETPEWVATYGRTIEASLQNVLDAFSREIDENSPRRSLVEEDFEWAACEDF